MTNTEKSHNDLLLERKKVIEEMEELKKDDKVQQFIKLYNQNIRLSQKQIELYESVQREKYDNCTHLFVYSKIDYDGYEGRQYNYCGCIKCGLDTTVLESDDRYIDWLPTDKQIMYKYLKDTIGGPCGKANIDIACDLKLGMAIYAKIKEAHPDIDDKTATKYFKIALDNIRNNKQTPERTEKRAKRLSLTPKFNRWDEWSVRNL